MQRNLFQSPLMLRVVYKAICCPVYTSLVKRLVVLQYFSFWQLLQQNVIYNICSFGFCRFVCKGKHVQQCQSHGCDLSPSGQVNLPKIPSCRTTYTTLGTPGWFVSFDTWNEGPVSKLHSWEPDPKRSYVWVFIYDSRLHGNWNTQNVSREDWKRWRCRRVR